MQYQRCASTPDRALGEGSDFSTWVLAGARSGCQGRDGTRGFVSPEKRGSGHEARLRRRVGKPDALARAQRGATYAGGDALQVIFAGNCFAAGPAAVTTYKADDRQGMTRLQKGLPRVGAGGVLGTKARF